MVNIKWKRGSRISQNTRNRKPVYTVGPFQFSTKKNEAPFQLKSDLGLDLDCRTCFWFKTSIKSCEFHSHFTIIQKKQICATKITTLPQKKKED